MRFLRLGALGAVAVSLVALAACSSGSSSNGTGQAPPGPSGNTAYANRGVVAIPGVPPATGTFSFDISYVDNSAGQYYLADRTTSGVDVVSTANATYIQTAGAGSFTGLGLPASAPKANTGGPNGVLPIGGGIVFAGDGNSTLKVVNVTTGQLVATIPTVNPVTTGTFSFCGAPTTGANNLRLDEMDIDPTDGVVLAINDASCPAFGTFFSTTAPYAILGTVAFPNATAGVEQPRWDPTQKKFVVAVPATVASPNGEIDLVDPIAHTITGTFPTPYCQPNSTAIAPNEQALLACSTTTNEQMVVMNVATGAVVSTIPGYAGCDEAWYDSYSGRYFAACSNNLNNGAAAPVLIVANANGTLNAATATAAGSHSVAVDSQGRAWVPQRSNGVDLYGPYP